MTPTIGAFGDGATALVEVVVAVGSGVATEVGVAVASEGSVKGAI